MKRATPFTVDDERPALIRLTALWALNEAGLGGLMHLFRSPFTGIFVGGGAILLIALIAHTAKRPGPAILQALLLVLIIKAAVSPHSPPTAYLAVGFQGLAGALLFSLLPSFRLSALMLGVLGLLESALQKLLVMTILFGMPLWKSVDAFIDYVLQKFGLLGEQSEVQGSQWLIGLYVGLYVVSGLAIGWLRPAAGGSQSSGSPAYAARRRAGDEGKRKTKTQSLLATAEGAQHSFHTTGPCRYLCPGARGAAGTGALVAAGAGAGRPCYLVLPDSAAAVAFPEKVPAKKIGCLPR